MEMDYAAQYRRDLAANVPAEVVLNSAKMHLRDLQQLRTDTPDRDTAIADMTAFLEEHQ
jgi:hypothetical protein